MEDLFPLLIFLVIVAVNAIKFFAERGRKKPAPQSGDAPPKRPSAFETFFEGLAKQMEPKTTELPDWPENRERPDYAQEMEEFEHPRAEEESPAIIPPMKPPASPSPVVIPRVGTRLRIQGRENLKRAMLAHIVFSPPRALDPKFSKTPRSQSV